MRLEGVEFETREFRVVRFHNNTKKEVSVFRFFEKLNDVYVDCLDVKSYSKSNFYLRTNVMVMSWSDNWSALTTLAAKQQLENSTRMALNLAKVLDR